MRLRRRLVPARRVPRRRIGRFERPTRRLRLRLGRVGDLLLVRSPLPRPGTGCCIPSSPAARPWSRPSRRRRRRTSPPCSARRSRRLIVLGTPYRSTSRWSRSWTAEPPATDHADGLQLVSPSPRRGGPRRTAAHRPAAGRRDLRATLAGSARRPGSDVGRAGGQRIRHVRGSLRRIVRSRVAPARRRVPARAGRTPTGCRSRPARPPRRVYVTNLYNRVVPLIRFEVTDEITIVDGALSVRLGVPPDRGPARAPRRYVHLSRRDRDPPARVSFVPRPPASRRVPGPPDRTRRRHLRSHLGRRRHRRAGVTHRSRAPRPRPRRTHGDDRAPSTASIVRAAASSNGSCRTADRVRVAIEVLRPGRGWRSLPGVRLVQRPSPRDRPHGRGG